MCPISINPQKWRFTWEAQSHTPNLKLFLFESHTKPSIHCENLDVQLNFPHAQIVVSWIQDANKVSFKVPIPKVLIDADSPVSFRALDDHIEIKLVLLLPVDHPIFQNMGFSFCEKTLHMDSDLESLSSSIEGVHFYCRSCSARLTNTPLRHFMEMPSVDWREIADNWFGAGCCSFGGISEKLVNRFADAYTCAKGVCLLNSAAVILCKDDLVVCKFFEWDGIQRQEHRQDFAVHNGLSAEEMLDCGSILRRDGSCDSQSERVNVNRSLMSSHLNYTNTNCAENLKCKVTEEEHNASRLFCVPSASDVFENAGSRPICFRSTHHAEDYIEACTHEMCEFSLVDQKSSKTKEAMANRRSFLNGFLGNVFMARSYNLSAGIEWNQFLCPQCSTLLGAYPCIDGCVPVDNGVRLFKCNLSTSLRAGASDDLLRKYTLEKMFTNQLIESAKDELSFRTVVRDLTTKSCMLQVVLLNPNLWCCTGNCLDPECSVESVPKLELYPIIKLLFSDCSKDKESQLRVLDDWVTNNLADEVFMLPRLIEELTETITSMKDLLPPSCTLFQGFSLSLVRR